MAPLMNRYLIFLLTLFISSHCFSETIVAAGDPWPPFLDPEVPSQGIVLEIARAAYKTQGYEVVMSFVPWARAINGVKEADYDVLLGTWYTKERTEFLHYSDPYLYNDIKFIKRKGDDFDYSGLESLTDKSIGIVRGYGYGDDFLNAKNFRRPETKDLFSNIKKLIKNRVDLAVGDEIVTRAMLKSHGPEYLDKIEFTKTALITNGLHVTSGLSNSKHKKLINAFNKGLKEIKNNGTFDSILKRYGF